MKWNTSRTVTAILMGFLIVLSWLYIINPFSRTPVAINAFFVVISLIVYNLKEYKEEIIGIPGKNFWSMFFLGIIAGFVFWLISKFVPGFSLGLPLLPQSIGDNLKFFFVVIVAPILETFMFQGSVYAYIKNFATSPKKRWLAIIISALSFSFWHLGAYISGLYQYNFAEAVIGFRGNISAFIVAFLFGILASYIVTRNGIKNLIFVVMFHLVINLLTYLPMAISFA